MRIIEFVGMPRAGKTTQAERVIARCASKGSRAVSLSDRERISVLHTTHDQSPMFDVLNAGANVEMYHACLKAEPPVDILILDRGWNDTLVWAHLTWMRNKISAEEKRAIHTLFWPYAQRVEKTLYFSLPTHEILLRHAQTEHMPCDDVALQPDFLDRLRHAYDTQWPLLKDPHRIDGLKDPDTITEEIVALLKL